MPLTNPLLYYREWFLTLEPEWADTISYSIFNSIYLFCDPEFKAKQNYEQSFEDDEEYEDGFTSKKFIIFLDQIIAHNDRQQVQTVALSLYSITDYTLLHFDKENFPVDCLELFKAKYIEKLLLGKTEDAAFFEEELEREVKDRVVRKEMKMTWDILAATDFNIEMLHHYLIDNMFGL